MAENTSKKLDKKPDIGGQAVLEGVMMKAPKAIAIAVRKPDGEIVIKRSPYTSPIEKHKWMGWPLIRGVVNLVNMLRLGMSTLDASTKMLGIAEEEPSKFEKWLSEKTGKGVDKIIMAVAIVLAAALATLLFLVIPSFAASWLNRRITSLLLVNLLSGVVRIVILIAYIWLAGKVPDMRRTFQYHGAEHQTVYCYEHDIPLTPENARDFSTLHPRCGTSFLLLVMIIAILLGAITDQLLHMIFGIGRLTFGWRLLRSVLILPLIAGISYEALKGLAHKDSKIVRALRFPGLMLQKLTTQKPDDSQIEVAIAAFNAAVYGMETERAEEKATEFIEEAADPEPIPETAGAHEAEPAIGTTGVEEPDDAQTGAE
jgi:uncharacterized protein YqhQ